ncbi:MAG TPA: thiamine pyrophosphate-binding protein [Rhodopseudomonas sp.]|uniref:thiamine pyrophosphate-binding protein n=1 Tax=Rhodopseudomonas sp. TaxID=1078 RepID=UPI002EDB2466
MQLAEDCSAAVIARFLRSRAMKRIFALCGGHIMPIWMRVHHEGVQIIDVRDERAAVHMAQAHALVTGEVGVALVTAGPGVTNAMTGIANAHASRTPLLILSGTPPRPQQGRGALQDLDHLQLLRSITRYARAVHEPAMVLQELDEAVSRARGEGGGEPGPVYLEFPTDTLRAKVPHAVQLPEHLVAKQPKTTHPSPGDVAEAVELLFSAKRPLIVTGRGAGEAGVEIAELLDRLGAAYLDSGESRGLIPEHHPSAVGAMRAIAMAEADLVLTIGRRLDFQLAYGSPAVFRNATFLRIADTPSELRDNRRGAVEIYATPKHAVRAIIAAAGNRPAAAEQSWIARLRREHRQRTARLKQAMATAPAGGDGGIHPNRLLGALHEWLDDRAILAIDGGDFLAFARVALSAAVVLDPGPLGCIGVGVPYGIAASLACPDRTVMVATGDGAFGFNAIELDTAVRHKAPVLIVVANNAAWQIEVHDQQQSYGEVVGTRLQRADHAAMARAFGMHGERVERAEDLAAALERAFANLPALLDVVVTAEAISSDGKSGLAWVPDLQALAAWDEAERQWREA